MTDAEILELVRRMREAQRRPPRRTESVAGDVSCQLRRG